ncbi:hypothetical protein [Pedobacter sp.]|jgi:hypothetical protein|uniref:hypothetical protein n=1 Tax=Pedobacter sp. TaxID=1411316 RepID=UPI002D10C354|nr:hypothetical protein [Pedobacter sp.]HWW37784.1 hypothetical protein [Pedobacter sp.]
MKRVFVLVAGLTGLTLGVNAQKLSAAKVPSAVKAAFEKKHPEIKTVTWEKEKGDYEAAFTVNGKKNSENYSLKGMLVESETEINPAELPKEASAHIISQFKNAKIKEAAKITNAKGEVTYEAEVNGKDLIFDAKGNPVISHRSL